MYYTGISTCDTINELHFEGNIVPHAWYKTIIKKDLKKPKPYLLAITILSDIVYWYRPAEYRDEVTGQLLGYKKKFKSDMLQRSYGNITEQFGCSYDMAKNALVFLENLGVIKRVFRDENKDGIKCSNIMFISLDVKRLKELTYPDDNITEGTAQESEECSMEHPGKFSRMGEKNFPEPTGKFSWRGGEIRSVATSKKTRTNTKNTKTKNTSKNTLSTYQGLTGNLRSEQVEIEGVGDSAVDDYVIDELQQTQAIPYHYSQNPNLMSAAIRYLCEYEHYQQYSLEADKQNAFELCVDCLIEMACDQGEQNYRGARITYAMVIDAINKSADRCSEGGLSEFLWSAVDDMISAEKSTMIRNIRKYAKALIWNSFSTYKVKSDALFNRTFDGV